MKTIYIQDDGSKIIYDGKKDDIIYGHIVNADGVEYKSVPVEQLLARGYWKPVNA